MRASLTTLRVFAAVAEAGSIRAASERLGRTPSATSETLKQFEQEIGAPLFESGRKNRLTAVGAFAHSQVRDLLNHVDRTLASLQAYSRNAIGRIDIAAVPSIATTILPDVIASFRAQWPAVEITARDADSQSVADLVQSGIVELGIASLPGERRAVSFAPLFDEPLGVICRKDDPLFAVDGSCHWSALDGRTVLANGISDPQRVAQTLSRSVQAPLVVYNVLSLLALVRARIGVTVLPRLSTTGMPADIGFIPIDEPDARRTVGVITRAGETLSPAAAAFLKATIDRIAAVAGSYGISLAPQSRAQGGRSSRARGGPR